ncbi:MAG: DUF3106 domain-containing protein [Caldimonas sp.]
MTPWPKRRAVSLALASAAISAFGVALAQSAAQVPVPRPPFAVAPPRSEAGVRWQALTPVQRQALGPLEREWPSIDAGRKQKWLTIADRYPGMPAPERNRITERMTEWARLTPAERGEVRLRYQEARQVPAPARSERWQEYQKLPDDAKRKFAARAARPASPDARPEPSPGAKPAFPSRDATQAKANVVPNPALAQPPRQVAPTVVQAAPGATTRLITRPITPPAHQQSGMPKVAATPEFVNRSTLLPRRGPQAAAVATTPPARPPATAATRPGTHAAPARPVEPTPSR